MGRSINPAKRGLVYPAIRMPHLAMVGAEGATTFFTSTTVNGGAASATQTLVTTNGLVAGQQIRFATAAVDRTILTVNSSTSITLTASVTTTNGEAVTILDNEPQQPIFRRLAMPRDGFITGFQIEMNALIAGSGATVDMNMGIFDCKSDVYLSPNDLVPGLEVIGQLTSAGMAGYSSRHCQDFYFTRPSWKPEGTPLWWGSLWRRSGTFSAGAFNGVCSLEPRAQLKGNAAYRASVKGTAVRAYSAATLAGLPAAIGSSFPTNWSAVVSNDGTQISLATLHIMLIIDATD